MTDNRRLMIALVVISGFCVVEIIGGVVSGSLALLADAGHMATDAAAIGLALWARWLAAKPSTNDYTFGKKRAQVLAAFVNGLALFVLIGLLLWESFQRIATPQPIEAKTMLLVATLGLFANFLAFYVLHRGTTHDVNMRGAILHVVGDMLGSVAAIISAGVIATFGWVVIDPIVTVIVSLLIGRSAWALTRETARVLMEGSPPEMDLGKIRSVLIDQVPAVSSIREMKVWMLTPDQAQLTMHVHIMDPENSPQTLAALQSVLMQKFGISHSTIQIEFGPVPVDGHSGHDHHHEDDERDRDRIGNVVPLHNG